MRLKSESGITLTALVVSIIVMLILASVTIQTSFTAYENTRAEKFKAQMKVIQQTLDDSVYPEYELWKLEQEQEDSKSIDTYLKNQLGYNNLNDKVKKFSEITLDNSIITKDQKDRLKDIFKDKIPSTEKNPISDSSEFYKFDSKDLDTCFGIKDIDLTVYINFTNRIIISANSVKVDNQNVVTLYELDKNGSIYRFDSLSATENSIIRIDELANYGTSKRIRLTLEYGASVQSNDYIKYLIRKAYYKNNISNQWFEVDSLRECEYSEDGKSVSFIIFESGDYNFRIEDTSGTATESMFQYTQFNIKNKSTDYTKSYEPISKYQVSLCNKPVLTSEMVPIKWVYEDESKSSGSWVVCSSIDPEWYDYSKNNDNKKWANIMFKKDVSRSGKGFEIGTEYKEGQTGSMFVWIPRYTINKGSGNLKKTSINFIRDGSITTTSGYVGVGNGYEVPIAFRNDESYNGSWDTELKGLWVAKYSTGIEKNSNVSINTTNTYQYSKMYSDNQDFHSVSKPYYIMWRNISFTRAFSQALMFYKNVSSNTEINSHLMKDSEYEVIKYITFNEELGNSKGISANNQNRYAGGSDGINGYSIIRFQNQSTTGNMTGIFDMVGPYYFVSCVRVANKPFLYNSRGQGILTTTDSASSYKNKYLQTDNKYSYDNMKVCIRNDLNSNASVVNITSFSDSDTTSEHENDVAFRLVLANSPASGYDNVLFDETNRIPDEDEAGFFVTDEKGNYIRNSSGEFKDSDGNPTYYSWETMIENKWIQGDPSNGDYLLRSGEKISELKKKTGILIIPDGITRVGDATFKPANDDNWSFGNWKNLIKVVFPDSVTLVSAFAFENDTSLETVELSKSLKQFFEGSFAYCTSLVNISLPDTLEKIGYNNERGSVFEGCSSLESITIPGNVSVIGCKSFAGCSNLTSLTFEDSKRNTSDELIIGAHAFYEIPITSLKFPKNTNAIIQLQAFRDCSNLTDVEVDQGGIKYIEDGVFSYCYSLKNFSTDNAGKITIRNNTFKKTYDEGGECGLFEGCSNLLKISLENFYCENGDLGMRTFYNCGSLSEVKLSSEMNLKTIRKYTFFSCNNLKNIELPNTIREIENEAFGLESSHNIIFIYYHGSLSDWNRINFGRNWYINTKIRLDTVMGEHFEYES